MHFKDIKIPREESRNQKKVRPLPDIFCLQMPIAYEIMNHRGLQKVGLWFLVLYCFSQPHENTRIALRNDSLMQLTGKLMKEKWQGRKRERRRISSSHES